jgi:sigma-B regulation protein RsbU (phosphoserine phosphatase)
VTALLSIAVHPISVTQFQLQQDIAPLVAGIVLLTVGIAAIALFILRRKSGDLTLIYFGLFSVMYAVRLLANLRTIHSIFDRPEIFWTYINWVITCTIVLPFGMFLYQMVSGSLRTLVRWLLTIQAAFAIVGILAAVFRVSFDRLSVANNIVVIGTFVCLAVFFLVSSATRQERKPVSSDIRIFLIGLLIWLTFALHANLAGLKLVPGPNVEFVGFLIFVGCLGYVTAHRTLSREERLLEINKELQIANQIQSSILPREVPQLAGLEIVARYLPMSAVAGDFYDFLVLDERRIGILVADVTGHGVPAALIASMLKIAFAGQIEHADDPARVLAGLNRALCGKFEAHFVTAAYIFLDLNNFVLRYAGAGHPPLLIAQRKNIPATQSPSREVEANGLMLGLFPEADYCAVEIPLGTGDRILLYTDGIVEAMNTAQEEFGKSRLRQFLSTSFHSAAHLADSLLLELRRWSSSDAGRPQADDITLLVLELQ